MPKKQSISPEGFDRLLTWLDQDRLLAAEKYEAIRARLIRFFSCRGCFNAEDLTDEAFDRVSRKADDLIGGNGNPGPYFYGVASNLYLEWLHDRRRFSEFEPDTSGAEVTRDGNDNHHDCLESCLDRLAPDQRSLVIEYYSGDGSAKIKTRKRLAEKTNISVNALQVRVLRVRASLRACVAKCLGGQDV